MENKIEELEANFKKLLVKTDNVELINAYCELMEEVNKTVDYIIESNNNNHEQPTTKTS